MKKLMSVGAMLVFLAGCSGMSQRPQPGPPPVKPPSAYVKPEVDVLSPLERDVWRPKNAIWKKFMLAVSRTNFYIDRVDEAKGELQVHYSGDPQMYVDCGRVVSSVTLPEGEKQFDFAAASPYQQYQVLRKGKVYQVERRMGLMAAVRMIFNEAGPEKTHISAVSSYRLTRDQSVVGGANTKPLLLNDTISFNTGEFGIFPNAQTKCQPTGKLESELLGLLK
jgi:hypothetical protein